MNVANLQLEGLLMGVAAVNQLLVRKGLLTAEEIDHALAGAMSGMTDERRAEGLSHANRDAINFPLRALQIAAHCPPEAGLPPFADLARQVGGQKPRYNDQA